MPTGVDGGDGVGRAVITRDQVTALIAECMALQTADASVGYDTGIAVDSFSFIWLQHVLDERFGYDLQPPDSGVLETLGSARDVHRYLARVSPDRFEAAEPAPPEQAERLDPRFEAVLRECLDGVVGPAEPLVADTDLTAVGLDSLTVVRLLVTLEDAFAVTVPEEIVSFELFSSPGALWELVSGLLEDSGER